MRLSDVSNPAISNSIGNSASSAYIDAGPATSRLLAALINFGFVAGVIAFVFMLLIGGYQWVTSGGDKDSVSKARNRIWHALIGLVILLSLYAFLSLLSGFFGFDLLRFNISPISL